MYSKIMAGLTPGNRTSNPAIGAKIVPLEAEKSRLLSHAPNYVLGLSGRLQRLNQINAELDRLYSLQRAEWEKQDRDKSAAEAKAKAEREKAAKAKAEAEREKAAKAKAEAEARARAAAAKAKADQQRVLEAYINSVSKDTKYIDSLKNFSKKKEDDISMVEMHNRIRRVGMIPARNPDLLVAQMATVNAAERTKKNVDSVLSSKDGALIKDKIKSGLMPGEVYTAKEKARIDQERLAKQKLEKEKAQKEKLEKERLAKEKLEKERIEREKIDFRLYSDEERDNPLNQKFYNSIGSYGEDVPIYPQFGDLFKHFNKLPGRRGVGPASIDFSKNIQSIVSRYLREVLDEGISDEEIIVMDSENLFKYLSEAKNRFLGMSAEEKERIEREKLEKERLAKEKLEKERIEYRDRIEKERLAKQKLAKEKLEKERLAKEKLEKERIERDRIENERSEKERADSVPPVSDIYTDAGENSMPKITPEKPVEEVYSGRRLSPDELRALPPEEYLKAIKEESNRKIEELLKRNEDVTSGNSEAPEPSDAKSHKARNIFNESQRILRDRGELADNDLRESMIGMMEPDVEVTDLPYGMLDSSPDDIDEYIGLRSQGKMPNINSNDNRAFSMEDILSGIPDSTHGISEDPYEGIPDLEDIPEALLRDQKLIEEDIFLTNHGMNPAPRSNRHLRNEQLALANIMDDNGFVNPSHFKDYDAKQMSEAYAHNRAVLDKIANSEVSDILGNSGLTMEDVFSGNVGSGQERETTETESMPYSLEASAAPGYNPISEPMGSSSTQGIRENPSFVQRPRRFDQTSETHKEADLPTMMMGTDGPSVAQATGRAPQAPSIPKIPYLQSQLPSVAALEAMRESHLQGRRGEPSLPGIPEERESPLDSMFQERINALRRVDDPYDLYGSEQQARSQSNFSRAPYGNGNSFGGGLLDLDMLGQMGARDYGEDYNHPSVPVTPPGAGNPPSLRSDPKRNPDPSAENTYHFHVDPKMEAEYNALLARQKSLSYVPRQHYPTKRAVPDLPPAILKAAALSDELMFNSAPYINRAEQQVSEGLQDYPDQYQRYMNPYEDRVLDVIERRINKQYKENLFPELKGKHLKMGRHGGMNYRKEMRDLESSRKRDLADAIAMYTDKGYRQSHDIFQSDMARKFEGAGKTQALGQAWQQMKHQDLAALNAMGVQRQGHNQAKAGHDFSEYLAQFNHPYTALGNYQNSLNKVPYSEHKMKFPARQPQSATGRSMRNALTGAAINVGAQMLPGILGSILGKKPTPTYG